MGLLSAVFGRAKRPDIQTQLELDYVAWWQAKGMTESEARRSFAIERQLKFAHVSFLQAMGTPASEAEKSFEITMRKIKERYINEGIVNLPANYGSFLLEQEKINPELKAALDKKRAEGVRDSDIRWWWNMHYFERMMMLEDDETGRVAAFMAYLSQGMSPDQAAQKLKRFLTYGDPQDANQGVGEDRALPIELKDRINRYTEQRMRGDPYIYKTEIQASTGSNAHVRNEMRKGRV